MDSRLIFESAYTYLRKKQIADRIQPLIGVEDFSIWNWSFQKVIEINKIGVYRKGFDASH